MPVKADESRGALETTDPEASSDRVDAPGRRQHLSSCPSRHRSRTNVWLATESNAWRLVFNSEEAREAYVRATVRVSDSRRLRGWVFDYPGSIDDVDDRDLVLVSPLYSVDNVGSVTPVDSDYMVLNERDFSELEVTLHEVVS